MFIAALFILTKTWKQSKYLPKNKWISKSCCVHTMEYYSAIKRNEPFDYVYNDMDKSPNNYE